MASKNSVKQYLKNGYYHLYNRGVNKQAIFADKQDYNVFLKYLADYLNQKDNKSLSSILNNHQSSPEQKDKARKLLRLNNFYDQISLLAYCLMPNHFHLLIKQTIPNGIDTFTNSLCLRYSMYFNTKYKRVGRLYQDVYKAVLVDSDEQLLYLTKYIHNQLTKSTQPSSLTDYLQSNSTSFVETKEILSFFNREYPQASYFDFVFDKETLKPELLTDLCFLD